MRGGAAAHAGRIIIASDTSENSCDISRLYVFCCFRCRDVGDHFDATQLLPLLRVEVRRGTLSVADVTPGGSVAGIIQRVAGGANVVLLARSFHRNVGRMSLPSHCPTRRGNFELRAVVATCASTAPAKWTGDIFARHGGPQFSGWWRQTRNASPLRVTLENGMNFGMWDVAVYVRLQPMHLGDLRNWYLKYIGGQCNIFCHDHKLPLIIAPFKKGRCSLSSSCGEICGKVACMECPVFACKLKICRGCLKLQQREYYRRGRNERDKCPLYLSHACGDDVTGAEPIRERNDEHGASI